MWVGRVWDRNVGRLFLFVLAVAHTPRVVNEAFDLRTVGQLQLDQLTQNFKLGAENNRVRKPEKVYHKEKTHFCVPVRGEKSPV